MSEARTYLSPALVIFREAPLPARLPTAQPPCNQASSVLGSPQSQAHMGRVDPDRASTNEAKWM
ncbi:hypothetical protein Trco_002840 [Trichoderma cornu-damae]|uniref:Uncharacterized protein n=1 Tax=Trichoderma cornu-damae TaxID=654480 RepID=A0A9P8QQL5_9HYPO|nr:hypothetical protein Trco_002840 [Trichoderma cornu-damae]